MQKTFCDRCYMEVGVSDVGKVFERLVMGSRIKMTAELCQDCILGLALWWEDGKKIEKERYASREALKMD